MKKVLIIMVVLFLSVWVAAGTFSEYYSRFITANSMQDAQAMKEVIALLQADTSNASLTALYINAVTEYANGAVKDEKEREKFYQQAVDYGKKIIKENKDNWYLSYTLGAAYGRLAQFKGIVSSLFMLGDFDANIKKSIELNPSNYLGYVALGMRYRDVPWPMNDMKKSEENFKKAIEKEPLYVNAYLELGMLYLKINKKELAREMFNKVISMQPHPEWRKQGEEAKKTAEDELKKIK